MASSPICHFVPVPAAAAPTTWLSPRTQIIFATCTCAGVSAFLYAFNPDQHAFYPSCFLYKTTGIYCAGCGATRALYALLHGHLNDALHDNALFIAALPVGIYLALPYLMRTWRANAWPSISIKGKSLLRMGLPAVSLMLAFMILRNLPGWPFELLKPLAAIAN